ncbi:Tetratricopeptide repeat-containing protein [Mariniphaga anaerophila]|uniref:Tetratricopeptide repeat-containing protein n=1 Tax=Mariniphaga anaerophila TaxID=1484053 RepID=A0A1M4YFX3_9BACT|nr:tetratricopeptide repeat protein [Mariniphaga anaerophila]SHF04630.1 Tetratricopeptide repeat-containing protein [Mariniphaga anaerophila]
MQKEQFYNLLDNTNLLNQETLTELKELTEKYPYFQSARLLYLKNLQNTGASDFESELKKAAPLVADRKQLYRILNPGKRKKSGNTNFENQTSASSGYIIEDSGKSLSGNSLIDKFLSAQPGPMKIGKISREKHLEDSENEIIAKSVAENDELVTETLATIYFEQKKYDKALEAFQKLSLKYPEKNVYFATRIEEIEKLKNI